MGKTKYLLFILLFIISSIHAQEGWFWQNPLPQGSNLNSIFFIDDSTGWAVGGEIMVGKREGWSEARPFPAASAILKTTNCGSTWQIISSEATL